MTILNINNQKLVQILKSGGVGILPTDTLYGLVGSALSKSAVRRIYRLKKRNPEKPFIILISSKNQLGEFDINIDQNIRSILSKYWPGPISIILPCSNAKFRYLHRGKNSLAFRLPKKTSLRKLIQKTGPLVAPSANPEGQKPAQTIQEAKKYFKNEVVFYVNKGRIGQKPSKLIKIENGKIIKIR